MLTVLTVFGLSVVQHAQAAEPDASADPQAEEELSGKDSSGAPSSAGPAQPEGPAPSTVGPQKPAAAGGDADAGTDEGTKEVEKTERGPKAKKNKYSILHGGNTGRLEVRGRVFALSEFTRRRRRNPTNPLETETFEALELSLASARMALDYEAPMSWLTAQVELELADGLSLKDGFIQARDQHFTVRAGQFKMPISPLEVDSPWTLPMVRRGFMHRILNDWMDIGGRRPGVLVGVRDKHGIRPSLVAGAFQGSQQRRILNGDRDMQTLGAVSLDSQSYIVRAGLEVAHTAFGAWYQYRVGSSADFVYDRYHTVGADAVVDLPLARGGLRIWGDLIAGEAWHEHAFKAPDTKRPIFVEGRALVALRFGGVEEDQVYVEPFGMFGALEPDRDISQDLAWEGALGMNVGFWKRARLTLQGEINRTQENFPVQYFQGNNVNRESLLLQAGVAW